MWLHALVEACGAQGGPNRWSCLRALLLGTHPDATAPLLAHNSARVFAAVIGVCLESFPSAGALGVLLALPDSALLSLVHNDRFVGLVSKRDSGSGGGAEASLGGAGSGGGGGAGVGAGVGKAGKGGGRAAHSAKRQSSPTPIIEYSAGAQDSEGSIEMLSRHSGDAEDDTARWVGRLSATSARSEGTCLLVGLGHV
jgi:hypothetical protein